MKRTLALLLALACVFSLTGCRTREERQTMRRQLDYANGTLEPDLPDHLETEDGTTLDEQVIYDKKGVTITALGIYEDTNYYYIPFSFRNNSKEDLSWFVDAITVNGWISFGWLEDAEQVVHGGLDYNTLRIDRDSLSAVLRPGRITGSFVLEDENWTTVSFSLTTSAGEGENKP
ncbi:MAG: hypothetical protein IJ049_03165, partial [Oscillospiraceae bacterium]|nr:hypothetical protein [Oscillospiraceae bacterium]